MEKECLIRLVAILRGINVGGKRKILMSDLKKLFEGLSFDEVQTFIQSGNIVFSTDEKYDEAKISSKIESGILDKFGFEVPVIIRSIKEMEELVLNNPFAKEVVNTEQLHVTFLKEKPLEYNQIKIVSDDKFQIIGRNIYLLCKGKYHETKLSNNFFEKQLKVNATTRNWKTVLSLLKLSQTE